MSQVQRTKKSPLPRAGSTRRCPNCGASSLQMRRWPQRDGVWQVSCSRCDHIWKERTARSFLDIILESRLREITAIALLAVAACIAGFASYIAWLFWRAADLGRPGATELAILFCAALTFTVGGLRLAQQHPPWT